MAAPRFDFAIEDFRIGGPFDVLPKLTKQSPRRTAKPKKSLAKSIGAFLLPPTCSTERIPLLRASLGWAQFVDMHQ